MTAETGMHAARDEETRRLIRESLDATLFVEAGAGTGKTRALVDRYVALVLAGRRVEELIAITFTEKAAAEMRDRVRGELERRLAAADGDDDLLQAALESLDRAQISTIHAFVLHELRAFAAEQGIDPGFEVLDEVAAERRFQERWRAFLEDAGQDATAREIVGRALSLGLTTGDIQQLAYALWDNGDIAEKLLANPLVSEPEPPFDLQKLQASLRRLGLERVPEEDNLRRAIAAVLTRLDELRTAPPEEMEALLATMTLPSASGGRRQNWGSGARIEAARAALEGAIAALQAALTQRRTEALSRLLPLALRFVSQESRSRQRDGELMFDDLILRLRDLLFESAEARRRLRNRYCAMLIDEFQDTDPLQVDIALAFAGALDSGHIEPGRLFLVGDPKQSIYRFRRADMAVYAATRRNIEAQDGRLPQLMLNRRSREPVLRFANQVLAVVIGAGEQPQIQPPYRPVYPERREELAGPGVACTGRTLDIPAREARRHEAGQVAAWCRSVLEQGWQVFDRTEDRVREARYRDIAILVPARTILQPLERALAAAGVPYRVEGGSLIYATQEVRDLINCLTAIDDPTDEVAIVAALRCPAYACSDVELAAHRLDGGSFNYLSPALDEAPGRVAAALRDLRAFHLARGDGVLAPMVEGFVAAHRQVEAGLFDSGNRNAFRRARFVIEQARIFEAGRPQSLRAFIDWLERRAGDAILDHEGAGLDDDEDAVRVLTIHAAKGLEFPIVFVAGLGATPAGRFGVLGFDRASGSVAIKLGAKARGVFTLGPVEQTETQEKEHEAAERARLLYVAATRARDHLLLFLYQYQKANSTFAQRLVDAGAREAATELPELEPVSDARLPPFAGLVVDAPGLDDEGFEVARAALVEAARAALVTSATALGRLGEEEEREDESEPWARGRAGTHRGRAVHAALQVLPWDADDETIEALARAQAVAEAVPEESGRIAELLRRALASDAVDRAKRARRALREVPFALVQDGVTLEGFVDLVIEDEDGLEVVDWKTDAVPAAAVPRRLQGYRLQAGLYVLGLEAATAKPVRRVTYVFVDPAVEVSPGDPALLAREAREQLVRARD